mgnify:CR=1 FL=1
MKLMMTTCKKATYLLSKKEENKLSWLEKIQLRGHLTICSVCRKFEEQTGFIGRNARHLHADITLPAEIKEKIRNLLKD